MDTRQRYREFLASKAQLASQNGFDPIWLPDTLFDFQRAIVEWAIRKGRAAIFADCGMGKTLMQLVWAENVVRKTNRPVLIVTPIAVGRQTVAEGGKFGVECSISRDGSLPGKIVVTNYERLHHFRPNDFVAMVADESSCIKNSDAKTRAAVTEFMRTLPYRNLCTATAAPNDYVELGTSAEALGEMGYQDMLTRFFKQQTQKDHLGWGRTKYKLRGYAENDFWRWICSWARAIRKPSDLGFNDDQFTLPPLECQEHIVKARTKRPGCLFDLPAMTMQEEREEGRRTLSERCECVAGLLDNKEPAVAWCHLNDEGDLLAELIPGAEQVSGQDSEERKEEIFQAFATGQVRVLVTKPSVAGFGLNWQHCARQTYFPSHSFEQWYQSIRRCWRFGQMKTVKVDVVSSEGQEGILGNLQAKAQAAEAMFARLVELMHDHLTIKVEDRLTKQEELPAWL